MALLAEVEMYLKSADLAPSRLGRDVLHDPRFVFDLRSGRVPGLRTQGRVRQFLEDRADMGSASNLPAVACRGAAQ